MNHKFQKVFSSWGYRAVVLGLVLWCGSYSYANSTQQSVARMIEVLSDPASMNFQITITEDDLAAALDIADTQGAATLDNAYLRLARMPFCVTNNDQTNGMQMKVTLSGLKNSDDSATASVIAVVLPNQLSDLTSTQARQAVGFYHSTDLTTATDTPVLYGRTGNVMIWVTSDGTVYLPEWIDIDNNTTDYVAIDHYKQFANTPTLVYASTPAEEITAIQGCSQGSVHFFLFIKVSDLNLLPKGAYFLDIGLDFQ